MSDKDGNLLGDAMAGAASFGKFVPGFDFLQNLAKGAAQNIPQLPNPANWVAPTLNVEELEKRISELKAVQFWLDQNAMALKATVQALEVQKMTLATLKGMNFNMGDVANALKLKASETMAETVMGNVSKVTGGAVGGKKKTAGKSAAASGLPDPMQWWGSLTKQFTDIAAGAMKDASRQTAIDTTRNLAKATVKTATGMATNAVKTAGKMGAAQVQSATKKVARSVTKSPAGAKKSTKRSR
jgi:hypothetical protein